METKSMDLCDRIGNYLTELDKWRTWRNIMLGQLLSLLLSMQTILCHFMTYETGALAAGQILPHYLLLFLIYTVWLGFTGRLVKGFRSKAIRYLLLSFMDVEANALITASHSFTTISSIQLLLVCVGIPVALVLTCLVLGVRYRLVHIVAVSVSLLGIGCLVWADDTDQKLDGKEQLMGDMLCLGGAVLIAIVTILQELSVKTSDVIEYLGFLGLFGTAITMAQMFILEKQSLMPTNWNTIPGLLLAIYGTIQFIFVSLGSLMIQNTSATTLHLSLLSSNYYTSIAGALLLGFQVHTLYFLSYALMITGVFIFSIKPAPIAMESTKQQQQQQRNSNSNRALIEGQDQNNSIASDGTVELLSNLSTVQHSTSSDTTFTSFYGTEMNRY